MRAAAALTSGSSAPRSVLRSSARSDALELFDAVATITTVGDEVRGITRESYGASETAALDVLCDWAADNGLQWRSDLAGNRIFESEDADAETPGVVCGSHIDSVPCGGNFDGLAGLVAGLLLLRDFCATGQAAGRRFRVAALRGEESAWFGKAYLGSSAALGQLAASHLKLAHRGGSLRLADAMLAQGAQPDAIARGERAAWTQGIATWIELHIEQGPVLIERNWPLAVVSAIRGNVRYPRLRCTGEAGHSGAVPRELRHDAVLATADLLVRLEALWTRTLAAGQDMVFTSGVIGTDSRVHAASRIPERVELSIEARSTDARVLENFTRELRTTCDRIANRRGVFFDLGEPLHSAPAAMDAAVGQQFHDAASRLQIDCGSVASGAGHDSAMFANAGIATAMLFVRNANGSHNPSEAMDIDDFMAGVRVIENVVLAQHLI